MSVTAIVLAGGASSRFGTDKLVATVEGRPLLDHAVLAVAAVADRVVLVLAPDAAVPTLPPVGVRVDVARDRAAHGGPLAGLGVGLAALDSAERSGVAIVVGGDMPSLEPRVLRLLAETLGGDDRLGAMTLEASGSPPLPMAVRVGIAMPAIDAILAGPGRRSLRALLEAVPSGRVPAAGWRAIDPDAHTLRDVDRPEDLAGPGT